MTLARRIETSPSEMPKRFRRASKDLSDQAFTALPGSSTLALTTVIVSTSLLALCMGGLLWNVYEPVNIAVSVYALCLTFSSKTTFSSVGQLPLRTLKVLITVGMYASITTVVFSLQSHADMHPVLGHMPQLASLQRAVRWLSQWCASLACAWVVIANCVRRPEQVESLVKGLIVSGGCVAGVGLVHWFTDNGYLFWTIAPQEIFVSNRLRWPFVNCDHMAAFLVMILFLAVAMTHQACYQVAHDLQKYEAISPRAALAVARGRRPLVAQLRRVLQSRHAAKNLAQGVGGLLIVVMLCVAVLGTLSRTAWFAMSIGFLIYVLLVAPKRRRVIEVDLIVHRRTKRTSTVRIIRQLASRVVRASAAYIPVFIIILVPMLFIGLLLEGGGGDLIEARLLESSKNLPTDYRWTMYEDSWKLLKSSPWTGIGVGQWQAIHTTAADAALAGVAIEYAHSDVIQTVVELGILGIAPLCVLAVVFVKAIAGIRREVDPARKRLLAGLATALVSGLICATFDFPLRLPAISYLFVSVLGMFAVLVSPKEQ